MKIKKKIEAIRYPDTTMSWRPQQVTTLHYSCSIRTSPTGNVELLTLLDVDDSEISAGERELSAVANFNSRGQLSRCTLLQNFRTVTCCAFRRRWLIEKHGFASHLSSGFMAIRAQNLRVNSFKLKWRPGVVVKQRGFPLIGIMATCAFDP